MSAKDFVRACYYDPTWVLRTYRDDIASAIAIAFVFAAWGLS